MTAKTAVDGIDLPDAVYCRHLMRKDLSSDDDP